MKHIKIPDERPDGRKKGLRIKITAIEVDDTGVLEKIRINYSGLHVIGGAIITVDKANAIKLPTE